MTLLFDTSILIDLERKHPETMKQIKELAKGYPLPAVIAFVSEYEFLFGTKEKNLKNKLKALYFLKKFLVLHTSQQTSPLLADLKYKYDKKGISLPLADLLIATLTIENNKILVTKDKDFAQIEELKKIFIN